MPHLKFILQHAVSPNLKLMRGKTIECISLIGLAVGKDKVKNFFETRFIYVSFSSLTVFAGR